MTHTYQQQQHPERTGSAGRKPVAHQQSTWESQLMAGVKKVGQAAFKEVVKDASRVAVAEVDEAFAN